MSSQKRSLSRSQSPDDLAQRPSNNNVQAKRSRIDEASKPPTLHAWLHPSEPPPLMAHSPPLHASSSTFLSFTVSFVPATHITSEATVTKEVRRIIRELDVVSLVGEEAMSAGEGAFQDGEGRAPGRKGKERAREPDHRMWAVRTLCLKEGKDGTKGEDDYQLLEASNDDGEKFGGERVLRILKEGRGVDVLTVCCRWYGGEMIGPIRFQHIGLTAQTSLTALLKLVALRDVRTILEALDEDIASLRSTLNPPGSPLLSIDGPVALGPQEGTGKYDGIDDVQKLERLVKAREKTKISLEGKVGWAGMEQASLEEKPGS